MTATGLTTKKLIKAAVEEQFSFTTAQCPHGHAHRRQDLFRTQKPSCTAWAQGRFGSSTTFSKNFSAKQYRLDRLAKRTCGVQAERTWSIEHIELKTLTVQEWLKTGRLRVHKVSTHDNLGRLEDQGHDSKETDQVLTCSELARIILHRLEPTCTVTSVTPITLLMNTDKMISESQTHSTLGKLENND